MKAVLLSGGSGKRLWPLYGESRSRQFLKVLRDGEGNKESIIMRVKRQLQGLISPEDLFITAIESQRDVIKRQTGMVDTFIPEPFRRGTYPAVLLSGAYLLELSDPDPDEIMLVLPVDPYVEDDYFREVLRLPKSLEDLGAELGLMGIKPTYPSTKYGYITGNSDPDKGYGRVGAYVEKPGLSEAVSLKEAGAFWNGGVFAMRFSLVEGLIRSHFPETERKGLFETVASGYGKLPEISFDREILERGAGRDMVFIPYGGEWKDLGTWNTLTEKMAEPDGGAVLRGEECENTHIINELEIPLVALGLKDAVVVASSDGILVSDKHKSSYMEPYVEKINTRPMYEKRQWGEYRVLDLCRCTNKRESSLTKRLYIEKGKSLSYQKHYVRDEIWTIIDGEGYFVLDGVERRVERGAVLQIRKGQWHSLYSLTGIEFIEVQLGSELVEEDIERAEYEWKFAQDRGTE